MTRPPAAGARLDDAGRDLAVRHLDVAIARGIAWARRAGLEYEDLIGAASLALCRAALAHDGSAGFRTYLRAWVDNECRDELRRQGRWRSARGPAALEGLAAPAGEVAAWAGLPDRDRRVIELRLSEGLLWREIAEELGVSTPRAFRIFEAALERLRVALDAGDPAA